jgi:uncharacterized protein YndB with AHSA1/START domain
MIDVIHQIDAVRRRVGSRVREAAELPTVTVSQAYDATVDDAWQACTDPERIARWFLPVSGDLRPHGRYQIEGNATGTIERCDPPTGFAATWEYGGELSWIEVRLSAEPDAGTRLERFMTLSSQRWCGANIAAGADRATAEAVAAHTAAAYTGAPAGS